MPAIYFCSGGKNNNDNGRCDFSTLVSQDGRAMGLHWAGSEIGLCLPLVLGAHKVKVLVVVLEGCCINNFIRRG